MGTVINVGLLDAFSPVAIATLVVFVFLIRSFTHDPLKCFFHGVFFFWALFAQSYAIHCGAFLIALGNPWFEVIARFFYIGFGVLMSFIGAMCLVDWIFLKRYGDAAKIRTQFLDPSSKSTAHNHYLLMIFVGAFLGIVSSVWPPHFYISILGSSFNIPGKKFVFLSLIALYQLVVLFPMVLISLYWFGASRGKFKFFNLQVPPSTVKIASSAILISVGSGLILVFL